MSAVIGAGAAVALLAVGAALLVRRGRGALTSPTQRAVYEALHTAALATRPLRRGLDADAAQAAAPHLQVLTGARAIGLTGPDGKVLAWHGPHRDLADRFASAAAGAADGRRRTLLRGADLAAGGQTLIVQPLVVDTTGVVGVLGVLVADRPGQGLLTTIDEVARYLAGQIELAELDASRDRLDRAELRALRAQISPHFIYNALNTVAAFVRTDPDRARELLIEFADFTRYSFRAAGDYTSLAEELRNIDRYLTLERARFGDTMTVKVQIAPEVLGVTLPFLSLQPLVENAVRHGLAARGGAGTITVTAADEGADCLIAIEDDGVGMDPQLLRSGALDARTAAGPGHGVEAAHIGLANVDDRLRATFGDDYGLVVETAPDAGTKVSMRVPKFRPDLPR